MKSPDVLAELFCRVWHLILCFHRYEVSHFSETIDDHENCIVTFGEWEFGDAVVGNGLPRAFRDWEGLECPFQAISDWLVSLAWVAFFHIPINIGFH